MKKLVLCTMLLFLMMVTAGCTQEDLNIVAEDVTTNTFLAKADGLLQVATVEDFDKDYYELSELEAFIAKKINGFNDSADDKTVTIDSVSQRGDKAIMILSYPGMEAYANFNEVYAAYFTGGIEDVDLDLPATLINTKNDSLASTQEILQNNKYKILVLYEPYKIIVDGSIKYYSENSEYVDDNKVQGAAEGITVVVFK